MSLNSAEIEFLTLCSKADFFSGEEKWNSLGGGGVTAEFWEFLFAGGVANDGEQAFLFKGGVADGGEGVALFPFSSAFVSFGTIFLPILSSQRAAMSKEGVFGLDTFLLVDSIVLSLGVAGLSDDFATGEETLLDGTRVAIGLELLPGLARGPRGVCGTAHIVVTVCCCDGAG